MTQVWKGGPSDRSQRLLLLALADSANDEGFCWPGTALLAGKASMSVRTALRALKSLENDGWIRINRKAHHCKGNTYEVNLDKLGDKKSHDKLSRDKTGKSQVTKRAESGDKTGNPPDPLIGRTVKNRKEPSGLFAQSSNELIAVGVFPLPLKDGSEYQLPQRLFDEYVKTHPQLDVAQQIAYMRSWLLSNPTNRKSRSGITKFIGRWLNREPREHGSGGNKRAPRAANLAAADYSSWAVADGESAVQQ